MVMNETFGECLRMLMGTFNLKGSVLAKGINVDSSLIYKWLRIERVPSYNSSYIDLIANYFVKSIVNSFQQESVIKALKECGFQITDRDPVSVFNAIRTCLLEAQGYSIEICANKNIAEKRKVLSKANNLPKTFNSTPSINNNVHYQTGIDNNNIFRLPEHSLSESQPLGSDNVKIIMGNEEVLYSALRLLQSASSKPDKNDDTILITLNNSISPLFDYKEYSEQWKNTLFNILKKGWTIIVLVRLNNDIKKITRIVEDLQFVLAAGKYCVYYYKQADDATSTFNELYIVPNMGALYCLSSNLRNQVDSAFLFQSKQSIKLLSEHFSQFFSSAKPLLHAYPSQATLEFQHEFAEIEESLGNRYVFKGGISTITIPVDLYEKYLKLSKKRKQEIALRLAYHKRRLEAFKTQIRFYKYKDIWFKESIEKLVNERKYSFDQYYILENKIPDIKDIVYHLENVVDMLERYENYEIAIVSKNNYKNISQINWMVKENSTVFIETFNPYTEKKTKLDYYNSEINLLISEKEVNNAFQDYFMMLWNEISDCDKQKKEVIKWLRSQIDLLKVRYINSCESI